MTLQLHPCLCANTFSRNAISITMFLMRLWSDLCLLFSFRSSEGKTKGNKYYMNEAYDGPEAANGEYKQHI